jgi:hypothetical protein
MAICCYRGVTTKDMALRAGACSINARYATTDAEKRTNCIRTVVFTGASGKPLGLGRDTVPTGGS